MGQANSGQSLYLPTSNSTQAAFSLSAGRNTGQAFDDPLRLIALENEQGIDIEFCGAGNEDSTIDYKVWCLKSPRVDGPAMNPSAGSLYLFGSGTATLGTQTGIGTYFESNFNATGETLKFADTLTFTLAAWGTYVVNTFQLITPTAYSPTGNAVACLTLPLLGRVCNSVVIEFDLTGATAANAMVSLTA